MIDHKLKKQMEYAFLNGQYDMALELSQKLDQQILKDITKQLEDKQPKTCK